LGYAFAAFQVEEEEMSYSAEKHQGICNLVVQVVQGEEEMSYSAEKHQGICNLVVQGGHQYQIFLFQTSLFHHQYFFFFGFESLKDSPIPPTARGMNFGLCQPEPKADTINGKITG
jgi:hypothetical protein